MTPQQKARMTLIEAHRQPGMTDDEAWEAYKQKRYYDPENAEKRSNAARIAGSSPKKFYPFQNKELASRAGKTKKRGENPEV